MIKIILLMWNLISKFDKLDKKVKGMDNRLESVEAFFNNIEKISYDYRKKLDN